MNKAQIEVRQKANNELGIWINNRIDEMQTKGFSKDAAYAKYDHKVKEWHDEQEDLDRAKEANKAGNALAGKLGGNPGDVRGSDYATKKSVTGKQLSPLAFDESSMKAMYKAFKNRQPMAIEAKSFSTVDSLLPAQLAPGVIAHQHEWRILDHLPATAITAPSYEFVVHNFADDTGGPTVVAEGASKPEYLPAAASSIATAVKLAMHTGISYETLADFPTWLGYVTNECFRQLMDLENAQLLYGNGESGNMTGFFNTSGILTHNASSDPDTYTAIDSIEAAITQLRVGNALAEPDLFITNPSTWSAIRRSKATTGQYILGDPLHEAVSSLWGIPVLITTAATAGQGLLLDTSKFGAALIREGIVVHQGFSGTDFVQNIARWVFEERLALAVERPQAVLALSNLPTS
jgi:HK97 family phage major capsid protein